MKRQAARVSYLELQIGMSICPPATLCEANHLDRWVNSDDRSTRHPGGELRGNLPIAAPHVQNLLGTFDVEQSEHFVGHYLLQR